MAGVKVQRFPDSPVTRVSRWCFNCYLIDGDDGNVVVVDAFMPKVVTDIAPLLKGRLPVAVAATHGHPDHVSGAPALAARYGSAIHLPSTTLSYIEDSAKPRTPSVAKLVRTWPVLFGQPFAIKAALGFVAASTTVGFGTSRGMLWSGPEPAGGLDDGDRLPGASSWSVINTPGHTDDGIAFWHSDSRTLLSGDAVLTIRGKPRLAPDIIDVASASRTAARLRALPVEHLLPGHGRPLHGVSVLGDAR
ncbi:MBL fold metallo-hydrolase [Mycobacterium sp.]|uniref:MBL fold metallo-hydrolase n=1 Tax=Mycobacterium sp. TaxID=1785 RepID=UPI0025D7F79A|nr:MBL fold metallo-hydrolase [Mycobacterium sp.]